MRGFIVCSLLSLAAIGLAGCGGSAVLIAQSRSRGLMGLEGDRVQAMADARRQMSEHCGGAYTIVREGTAVTGVHHGEELTEYLVEYACGAGTPAPKP